MEVPGVVWVLAAIVLVGIVTALVDLARHDVRLLPRWAWALVIIGLTFPMGVIGYLVLGRVPRGEAAASGPGGAAIPPTPEVM